jgi:4-azaleucine resistance transporter AzlC
VNAANKTGPTFRQGLIDALPITLSFILFGGIFGTLSMQVGLSPWQSAAMSLIVYAGSAQFTALSMLAEQANWWAIVLATFLLNSRHLLMGLSLSPYYQHLSTKQVNLLAFFLSDEQYAITLNRFQRQGSDIRYIVAVSLMLYAGWNVGTLLGTIAGRWIPDPAALGLGFSFTAMFLALAYYQLTSALRIFTFVFCGAAAVGLALILPDGLHLLAAGVISFLIGYLFPQAEPDTAGTNRQAQGEEGIA